MNYRYLLWDAAASQVTGGLRLGLPLSVHLYAVVLCDIFGGVTPKAELDALAWLLIV